MYVSWSDTVYMSYSTPPAPCARISEAEYSIALPKSQDAGIDMAKELMAAVDNHGILGKAP